MYNLKEAGSTSSVLAQMAIWRRKMHMSMKPNLYTTELLETVISSRIAQFYGKIVSNYRHILG
jgi:hypothetical protein